jgi:apolipoprotein N-acyltransferase
LNLRDITPGEGPKVFPVSGMKIQPLICYEIQFGDFVAKSVGFMPVGKVILTQSNDGWFGKGAQSEQHRTSNTLRAIETRLPVVHLINNGKSAVVLPNGRTIYLSKSWKREAANVMMPYNPNEGGSFYTKNPGLIFNLFRIFFVVWIVRACWKNRKKRSEFAS